MLQKPIVLDTRPYNDIRVSIHKNKIEESREFDESNDTSTSGREKSWTKTEKYEGRE